MALLEGIGAEEEKKAKHFSPRGIRVSGSPSTRRKMTEADEEEEEEGEEEEGRDELKTGVGGGKMWRNPNGVRVTSL